MDAFISWLFLAFTAICILSMLAWAFEQIPLWLEDLSDDEYPNWEKYK